MTGKLVVGGAAAATVVATAVLLAVVASTAPRPAGTDRTAAPSGAAASRSTAPGPAPSPSDDPQARYAAAAALAHRAPGVLAFAVRDRATGTQFTGGNVAHAAWAASTVKLAMAVGLLERHRAGEVRLDATARRQVTAMLRESDDAAATALWNRYGRDTMILRFQQVYGMKGLTFVQGFERFWSSLKCTTADLLRLAVYVLDRLTPEDRAVVVAAMREVGPAQRWGVWSAGPHLGPGTKNGWSIETDAGVRHWVTHTVGFAGPGERYAVAVMYDLPPGPGVDAGVRAVSDVVATIFGTPVPAAATVPDASTGG